MSGLGFALRLARREARSGARRVGVYMASITLGVGALVAIHSFREDVARSVEEQAKNLMGADARIASNRSLPDSVASVVDSLVRAGGRSATVTTALSMVMAPSNENVRLLQVRAVDGGWPFYGRVTTTPEGRWGALPAPGAALVDPAVLTQLDVAVGDSLAVGSVRVRIAGTVVDLPTDIGFQTAVGARVWISDADLERAGLLGFGSLARYETFLSLPGERDAGTVWSRYTELFRETGVGFDTAGEQARELTDALDFMARYLGLVGLGALLLGGVGVASAIHVYVREKLTGVAVLRCLGARQWTAFNAYLLQAAALGLLGALAGVAVGVAVQQSLPTLLAGVLPVDVDPRVSPATLLGGLAAGTAVSVLFALGPLLAVRDVPPLQALRREVEPEPGARLDPLRALVWVLVALAVTVLAVLEAPSIGEGLGFAAGLATAAGLLWLTGALLVRGTRRFFPGRARYTVRQGVANLFRPGSQTLAVTLALGMGAFVVGTILQVQASLGAYLALDGAEGRPNLLLFDIQPDQLDGVLDLLPEPVRRGAEVTPIVPARIAAIGGREASELRAAPEGERPERWALRREYRHTYRGHVTESEEVVAGEWFDASPAPAGGPARISMEVDLADDLAVGLGDTITWDVSGRRIESVVTSLRRVDWERFATNFFVVFEPGVLERAPATTVVLARVADDRDRAALQRDLVRAFPNVSALDLSRVREVVDSILGQVDRAVRFLAAFSAAAGLLVLAGALATSRHQRIREGALLRTLGARRGQVVSVLLAEYVALGSVAAISGLTLSLVAGWLLATRVFEIPFAAAIAGSAAVAAGVVVATVMVGLVGSRGVVRRSPLPVLREATE